jgi:hypothetical protein
VAVSFLINKKPLHKQGRGFDMKQAFEMLNVDGSIKRQFNRYMIYLPPT